MRKRYNILILLPFLIFIAGCQYDPYANTYTTKKPKESHLEGKYIFEFQTVDTTNVNLNYELNERIIIPEIQIYADGTYIVSNLPVFEYHLPTKFKDKISKRGNWKLIADEIFNSEGKVKGYFYKIELRGLPFEVKKVGLMNNKYPYGLIFGFGDPDQGHVMVFKKE